MDTSVLGGLSSERQILYFDGTELFRASAIRRSSAGRSLLSVPTGLAMEK